MNTLKVWGAACAFYLVIACAQLGLAPAQSFEEKLAYAYGVHTAVTATAAAAVSAKALTPADGAQVLSVSDQARTLLDAARTLYAAQDTTGADAKLVLATGLLTQLQTYLNSRGIK